MAIYTSVDAVAARFPKFQRTGPLLQVTSVARASGVVTVTTATAHGASAGWTAALIGVAASGPTNFNDSFTVATVPDGTHFTVLQDGVANDTGSGGQASVGPQGKTSDGQLLAWIQEQADLVEANAMARGYNLAQLPPATAADANTVLTKLNKLGAQAVLGEAIQSAMGLTGEWQLLKDLRAELQDLIKAFRAGAFDKLFVPIAGTLDVGPTAGGFAPCRPIFRREQKF